MAIGTKSPLQRLQDHGQSVWLDYLRRSLMTGGELQRLIEEDGVRGITSNPSTFAKAVVGSTDYTGALEALEGAAEQDAKAIYERLAIEDIQLAADLLRPVYEETAGRNGPRSPKRRAHGARHASERRRPPPRPGSSICYCSSSGAAPFMHAQSSGHRPMREVPDSAFLGRSLRSRQSQLDVPSHVWAIKLRCNQNVRDSMKLGNER